MGDRYNPLFELGAGAFGKAWVVKDNVTQKKHVSKVIQIKGLSSTALDRCLTEVTVLSACSHVNIVRYIEAFVNDGSLHIIMEYAAGGDLQQKIDKQNGVRFPSETVIDWFLQVVLALEYIHQRNILHRDLKPQNIFLTDNGIVKLGDFGIARVLNDCDDLALTRIGTPLYISPEICERKPYNSSSDMWAAGCLLYQMCLLRVPFQACNFDELTKKIVQAEYEPIPRYFSPLITRMITGLLVVNPNERLTAKTLLSLEDASKMLMLVKKKNRAIKSGQSSRPRSNSLVTRRSRLKVDQKIRASSVDRSGKNVSDKPNLKPRVINAADEFGRIKKDAKSEVTDKRYQTPVACVRSDPDKRKEADMVDSVKECSNRHKVDYSKHEGHIKTNIVMSENGKTIETREKSQPGKKFSKHEEELIMKGKTYTIRDTYMKKLSHASPILAKTICKQRFSLSISEPEALNAGKTLTEVTDHAAADDDDVVDGEEDVFSSPCCKPKARLKINSLTYNIYDKVDANSNSSSNNSSNNNNNNNNYNKCEDAVDGKLKSINYTMLQALSAVKFNKELSKNILLDEIIRKTGEERCDYLLNFIDVHVIEKGQSVQSLKYFVKENELTSLPLIAMYLSLQSTGSN